MRLCGHADMRRNGSGSLASTSYSMVYGVKLSFRHSIFSRVSAASRRCIPLTARKKDGPQVSGFNFERTPGAYRVSLNGNQLLIPEQTVMLSGLALLGLGAIIGKTGCTVIPDTVICHTHYYPVLPSMLSATRFYTLSIYYLIISVVLCVGPIIIGLALTAVSIGFTLSVGALALSTMFIPMLLFSIITFGFFSSFAMFGVGIFAPSLLPMVYIFPHYSS